MNIALRIAALLLPLLGPATSVASTYSITAHNVTITAHTAQDFVFGEAFFDSVTKTTTQDLTGDLLQQLTIRCNDTTCPPGSEGRILGGTRFFYTLGTTRGGDDIGTFSGGIGGDPSFGYTGASGYAIQTPDGLAVNPKPSPTGPELYLRIWSGSDAFLATNLYFSVIDPDPAATPVTYGADSRYLGSAPIPAQVPLPAGYLLVTGALGTLGLAARRRG